MRALITLAVLFLTAACGEEEAEIPPTSFERDLAEKLNACSGCHGQEEPKGGLVLTDPRALVNQPSSQADMVLIEPGNHLRSYLWHKVAGTHGIAGGLGQRMPAAEAWTKEDIELLGQWIDLNLPQ